MKNIIFIALSVLISLSCVVAQKNDYNWVSGYWPTGSGQNELNVFNFNSNSLSISLDTGMVTTLSSSELVSISDSMGNFLFYSNGLHVADRNYEIMPNGSGLNASYQPYTTHYPIIEGAISIPKRYSDSIYYIFHLSMSATAPYHFADGLHLTTVDMSLRGGLGDVISKNQTLLVDTLCSGQLEAVKHANGLDWWLLIPENSSNGYYRFLVTPDTILGPFYQQIGRVMLYHDWGGGANFSPDGSKYARYRNDLDIFDFNRCTGELYNPDSINLFGITYGGGCTFSQNGQYLYISTQSPSGFSYLVQLNRYAPSIQNSIDTIWEGNISTDTCFVLSSQLAPDGKIYITSCDYTYAVINEPDKAGDSCGFQLTGIPLPSATSMIPNFPHFRTPALPDGACDTAVAIRTIALGDNGIRVWPNPSYDGAFSVSQVLDSEIRNPTAVHIEVRDLLGRLVHQQAWPTGQAQCEVQLLGAKKGMYILSVWAADLSPASTKSTQRLLGREKLVILGKK